MLINNYLLLFLSCFIQYPIIMQLEVFRAALLCHINIGALIMCCKIISGHLSIDLDILGRRNQKIITIYKAIKDPGLLCLTSR